MNTRFTRRFMTAVLLATVAACDADTPQAQAPSPPPSGLPPPGDIPTQVSATETAQHCLTCHQAEMALSKWDALELRARIEKLSDGSVAHPPLQLPTTEAALTELVELLADN